MGRRRPDVPLPEERPAFEVNAVQHVSLTFPKATYGLTTMIDFTKNLSAEEASALSVLLADAARRLK